MEDVRAVAMALYARLPIQRGVAVAADMVALVDDGDRLFQDCCDALGKGSAPKAGAYDEVLHNFPIIPQKSRLSIY